MRAVCIDLVCHAQRFDDPGASFTLITCPLFTNLSTSCRTNSILSRALFLILFPVPCGLFSLLSSLQGSCILPPGSSTPTGHYQKSFSRSPWTRGCCPRKPAAAAVWPLPAVWPGKASDAADGPENSSGAQIQGLSAEEEKSSTLGSFVCLARIGSETSDFPMRMTPDRSEAFDVGCPDHLTDDYLGNA
jgi:hypothetical protein